MNNRKTVYAVLGAGNGGQAVSGYLGYLGYEVRLYDSFDVTINKIKEQGGIKLEGETEGFGRLALATTCVEKAVTGADIIMVVNPSIYHREIARRCAPFITEEQMIILHPGATFGAFAFKKALRDFGCKYEVPISESNTLIYACRAVEPGRVSIGGKKDRILVATLPAIENPRVCKILQQAYPEVEMADNVLVTSLDNTNPILHPAPTLLSTSWIESEKSFLYYSEGISESIGKFIEGMDSERVAVGKALGLEYGKGLISTFKQYELEYAVTGESISDIVKRVHAYANIYGPNSLKTRYLYEDIPMGLVPLVSVGRLLKVPVNRMETIIRLGELMMNEDFMSTGRNLTNLGLDNMSALNISRYAVTGVI